MAFRHLLRAGTTALALVSVVRVPHPAGAQTTTTLAPDASTLPRGMFRTRLATSWTRFDELFGVPGASGTSPLAFGFNFDSLGTAQLPFLQPSETAIRAVTGTSNFKLDAGKLTSHADSRVVVSPLILEYAINDRITLGLSVPLVETRTTLVTALNSKLGFANVGPNPSQLDAASAALNAAVVGQFSSAATTLNARLASCAANPAQPQCSTITGHEAAAQALVQSSNTFSGALGALYGTGIGQPGQTYVPLAGTTLQQSIIARIAQFDTAYLAFLGTNAITGAVAPARGPAALQQLNDLMVLAGHDTVGSTDRTSIGDITLGAVVQLVNNYGDSAARTRVRLSVNGAARFPSGQPGQRNRFYDIGTGTGQMGFVGGAAADIQVGRVWSATALASYALSFGNIGVSRVPNPADTPFPLLPPTPGNFTAGNQLALTILPRFRLTRFFGLNGNYTFVHVGSDTYSNFTPDPAAPAGLPGAASATAQQLGFGFSYSTVTEPMREPGRIPFEVLFSHTETIAGSGGPVPKTFRDLIELRVYFGRKPRG